jgi:hypothetical protein
MPMDTGLLYGEMVGSAIMHAAIPFAAVLIIKTFRDALPPQLSLLFLAFCVVGSFLVQMAFLAMLQANACNGIKNFAGIANGAGIGALITCILVAIPVFIDSMRLMVSQLFFDHQVLLTPQLQKVHDIIAKAGTEVMIASDSDKQTGGSLSSEEYGKQTLNELSTGTCYWIAFAGAYGVAFGSLMAATCPGASGP